MTKLRSNDVSITIDQGTISFTFNGYYMNTGGQPWNGVSSSVSNGKDLTVNVQSGRKSSSAVADYFMDKVNNDDSKVFGAVPDSLNFAVCGELKVDDDSITIVLGQGHSGTSNIWYIGSEAITTGGIVIGDYQYGMAYHNDHQFDFTREAL